MGPSPSKIHTEACEKWLDTIYHGDKPETPELRAEHKEIMLEIKKEWDLLDATINKGEEMYKELPFPGCGTREDFVRILEEYKKHIGENVDEICSKLKQDMDSLKFKDHAIKEMEEAERICHELKQNIGFNLLDFEINKAMLEKVIAVEDLPVDEMRKIYKENLGTFMELSLPFMEKYELQNFPAALAMFGQGNLHRMG